MLEIDGSIGEGGGQIVRTALALSLVTRRSVRIVEIRAGRRKPGLRQQHLTAANAAARVGCARLTGNELGSRQLTLEPGGTTRAGRFRFEVGTAGSATLVLQTVLPALALADAPSRVELGGGTHNPFAPPFDFLAGVFLPLFGRMGPKLGADLQRYGFYPAGGGRMTVDIEPVGERLEPIELVRRGRVERVSAEVLVANLPDHIGEREARVLSRRLALDPKQVRVVLLGRADSNGPGNVAMVRVESEHLTELFSEFGAKGVAAERVATRLADRVERYLAAPVAVGQRLADQLLLPLALAGGGRFTTLPPSRHTLTNVQVIGQLLPEVSIDLTEIGADSWLVSVGFGGGAERQGER